VLTRRGYARYTQAYDKEGQPARRTYYDLAGKPVPTQVVVVRLAPGGQAERLGLKPGDVLLRYDGRPVAQAHLFLQSRQAEGSPPRPLAVQRKDRTLTVEVPPGPLGMEVNDTVMPTAGD
jgi:S1-C subfamily serine protease